MPEHIETGVAYARQGPNGYTLIRFVVAVGKDAAPVGHELHDQPAVKFRRVTTQCVHAPEYLALAAFLKWGTNAYVDETATQKALDYFGYRR